MRGLSPTEQLIYSEVLSANMKEKLGNFDLEFCSAEDMAMYFRHAIFDRLASTREAKLDEIRHLYADELDPLVHSRFFHKRDSRLSEDALDILEVIITRDEGESGFAKRVIDGILDPKVIAYTDSAPGSDRRGLVNYVLEQIVDILESENLLEMGRTFFATHRDTMRFAKMCSERMGQEWSTKHFLADES
ncbi:hypothetical protein HY024_01235 [Candidatus Curtissbacteria bacterium]|nr:hypothetical protein [Candidatus Curtissbacteria bacterium]